MLKRFLVFFVLLSTVAGSAPAPLVVKTNLIYTGNAVANNWIDGPGSSSAPTITNFQVPFSIEVLCTIPANTNNAGRVFIIGDGNVGAFLQFEERFGYMTVFIPTAGGDILWNNGAKPPVDYDVEHHYVLTSEGSSSSYTLNLYRDGSFWGSFTYSGNPGSIHGNSLGHNGYVPGHVTIAKIALYDVILTASQVASLAGVSEAGSSGDPHLRFGNGG